MLPGSEQRTACCRRADCVGILPANVDQPLHAGALANLVASWCASPCDIVRPLHGERHGHPVIFPGELRAELAAVNDVTEDPGAVLRRHASRTRAAPTAYAHVLLNMNALAAYDTARAAFDLPHPDALRGRKA